MESDELVKKTIFELNEKSLIEINQLSWTDLLDEELFDFEVNIKHGQHIFEGRGTDFNGERALLKAYSECLERICCYVNDIDSTNGCAVHSSMEEANINAKNELIERDAFLLYFVSESLPKEIVGLNKFDDLAKLKNAQIKNYVLKENDSIYVVLSIIFSTNFVIAGLGNANNLKAAQLKADIESVRQFVHLVYYDKLDKKIKFPIINFNNFNDHGNQGFDKKYIQTLSKVFLSKPQKIIDIDYDEVFCFENKSCDLLKDSGLFFSRCSNKSIFDLTVGDIKISELNNKRLRNYNLSFKNKTIKHFIR